MKHQKNKNNFTTKGPREEPAKILWIRIPTPILSQITSYTLQVSSSPSSKFQVPTHSTHFLWTLEFQFLSVSACAMQDPSRPITGYPAAPNGFPPPQHGAAYPYAAQPPQQQPYPYQYQYRPASSRPFMRRFLSAMIASFVVMGVVILVLWLVLRPRLPDFRVESLSLSKFSTASNSSSSITGTWNVRFAVYNPNKKMSISYDVVDSGLFYRSQIISQTRLPPFKQGKRNQTVLDAAFSAADAYLERRFVNDINGDRARGSVSFNVKVEARVQFRAGGWRVRSRWLRVLCQSLAVGLSSNSSGSGNLMGAPRDCRVFL